MRKLFQVLLLAALSAVLVAPLAAQYTPGVGINNTPHDIQNNPLGGGFSPYDRSGLERICIYCHAPHNAYKLSSENGGPADAIGGGPVAPEEFTYLPLWNHEPTANIAFTMYQNGPDAPQFGPKASQAIDNGMTVGGVSLLCLSCHDGSVAVNSYGNIWQPFESRNGGSATMADGGTPFVIGQDAYLGNHHPIGFDYGLVEAVDTEIHSAASASFGLAGTVEEHLYNGKMECGTCHSVHNKGNTGERLLWRTDYRSGLCLTCHDKGTVEPLPEP